MMRRLVLALLASTAFAAHVEADVEVDVLGLFKPRTVVVHPAGSAPVRIDVGAPPFEYRGEFVVEVPGRFERRYQGAVRVTTVGDRLAVTVSMFEREYLARVAAAEMNRASQAALEAQVIAARSYLHAAGRRHPHARVCDTTHCQWVADRPPADHPAWDAVDRTEDVVLQADGKVIEALYSRQCGGRTRDGLYAADSRYRSVRCPVCQEDSAKAEGHQTGLCQRGAKALGERGKSAAEILRVYFPHATLTADARSARASFP